MLKLVRLWRRRDSSEGHGAFDQARADRRQPKLQPLTVERQGHRKRAVTGLVRIRCVHELGRDTGADKVEPVMVDVSFVADLPGKIVVKPAAFIYTLRRDLERVRGRRLHKCQLRGKILVFGATADHEQQRASRQRKSELSQNSCGSHCAPRSGTSAPRGSRLSRSASTSPAFRLRRYQAWKAGCRRDSTRM